MNRTNVIGVIPGEKKKGWENLEWLPREGILMRGQDLEDKEGLKMHRLKRAFQRMGFVWLVWKRTGLQSPMLHNSRGHHSHCVI